LHGETEVATSALYVGFEVFTDVVMKSIIFWDMILFIGTLNWDSEYTIAVGDLREVMGRNVNRKDSINITRNATDIINQMSH
jgi:hypothetical protein